jgi:hypothetical protein
VVCIRHGIDRIRAVVLDHILPIAADIITAETKK